MLNVSVDTMKEKKDSSIAGVKKIESKQMPEMQGL